jgi:hypothetical protein
VLVGQFPPRQCRGGGAQGLGTALQRVGGADALVGGGGGHARASVQPPGRGGSDHTLVGAGGAHAVDVGQQPQPAALELVDESSQPQDALAGQRVGQAGGVLGGQLGDLGGKPFQAGGWLAGATARSRGTGVRVHGATLPRPATPNQGAHKFVDNQMNAMRGASSVAISQVSPRDLTRRRPVAMLHAGLDLSRRRLDVCLLDQQGGTVQGTQAPPDVN